MYLPKGVLEQEQLAAAIADVERMFGPDVVRLRYTVRENWSGDPSIYFRFLLSDQVIRNNRTHEVAKRLRALVEEHIDPINKWDLIPYYAIRSQSEQEMLKEATWA